MIPQLPLRVSVSVKTMLVFLFACLTGQLAWSQWTGPDASNNIHNTNTHYVGVGVTVPTALLHVAYSYQNPSFSVGITGNRANTISQTLGSFAVVAGDNTSTAVNGAVAWDYYNNGTNPSWAGALLEHVGTAVTGNQYGVLAANQGQLLFQNVTNGVIASNGANIFISPLGNVAACFLTNGNVGIGTLNPGTNKLAVEGTIGARKVVVTLSNPFPDYVFQPGYLFPSLKSLEEYITANRHLPDMPTADSVAKSGLDLGNMQTKLLEKIEQLTLYTIDLQKQVETLREENKKFADLQQQIDELKKKVE